MCERVCMSKSVRQEVFRGLGFFWELVHLLLPTRFWSQPVPWAGLIISSERGEGWAYRKWERWEVWCCKQRDCEDWRGIGNDSMTSIQETVCLHVSVFVPFYVYAYWVRASGLCVCVCVCGFAVLELATWSVRATGNCWSGWEGSNVTWDRWVGGCWGSGGWNDGREIWRVVEAAVNTLSLEGKGDRNR